MSFDEELADRLREVLYPDPDVTEKRMFGGLAFLVSGNMAVSASREGGLLLRVDPVETDKLLRSPNTRSAIMRGRAMDGWLRVDPEGVRTRRQLEKWALTGVRYARSLPPKR